MIQFRRSINTLRVLPPFYRAFVLPTLSTRPYIHVIDPFMKVIIDAKEKGSPLTIDDILFATRALALDASRDYDRFKLLNETFHTLTLEPEIYNM